MEATSPSAPDVMSDPFEITDYMNRYLRRDNWVDGNQYAIMLVVPQGQKVQRVENKVDDLHKYYTYDAIDAQKQTDVMKFDGDQFVVRSQIRYYGKGQNRYTKHSEIAIMEAVHTNNDLKQVLAQGADVYFYTTNSPCSDCSAHIGKFVEGAQQDLMRTHRDAPIQTTLPAPSKTFLVYDQIYNMDAGKTDYQRQKGAEEWAMTKATFDDLKLNDGNNFFTSTSDKNAYNEFWKSHSDELSYKKAELQVELKNCKW